MCVLWWHGGVDVKRFVLLAGFGAALAVIASTASLALEEQKGAAVPQPAVEAPKADVQDGATVPKTIAGTEIRIPGLGKLGTLPKMDFGLELLYGANDTGKAQEPVPSEPDNGDLTIRGSIKHKF